MDWQKLINEMNEWARFAQQESNQGYQAYLDSEKLSKGVEEDSEQGWIEWASNWTFSPIDSASKLIQDDKKSEWSRAVEAFDKSWVIVQVSGSADQIALEAAKQGGDPWRPLGYFNEWLQEKKSHFPESHAKWQRDVKTKFPSSASQIHRASGQSWLMYYAQKSGPVVLGLSLAGITYYGLAKLNDSSPTMNLRQNPSPMHLGVLPAVVVAVMGAKALSKTDLVDSDAIKRNYEDLLSRLEDGERFQGGTFADLASTTHLTKSSSNICSSDPDDARYQTGLYLLAAAYASNNMAFQEEAESYVGSWYWSGEGFDNRSQTASTMRKVKSQMLSDSNPLVQNIGYALGRIADEACMAQTQREQTIANSGGVDPCPNEDKFTATMKGLFMFQAQPCYLSKNDWFKLRFATYGTLGAVGLYFGWPVIKPAFSIVGSTLQMGAKKLKGVAEDE